MDLLLFFALPLATIILSIALSKLFKNPVIVAGIAFASYLIVTFTAFNTDFLIFVIIYTIIAYITALFTCIICRMMEEEVSDPPVRKNIVRPAALDVNVARPALIEENNERAVRPAVSQEDNANTETIRRNNRETSYTICKRCRTEEEKFNSSSF